jgi:hypothetical protein
LDPSDPEDPSDPSYPMYSYTTPLGLDDFSKTLIRVQTNGDYRTSIERAALGPVIKFFSEGKLGFEQ